jgi:hypothetical protein
MMRLSTAVRLSVLIALLAVPADALGASTVRTSSVSGRLVVPSGGPRTLSLHCPADAVALNGAITRKGRGVVVRSSMPGRGSGDWAFRVAASGAGSRTVSAVLRCVSLRLPEEFTQARVNIKTQRRTDVVIAPGATATTEVACGARWTATGYGLSGGRRGNVRFAEVVPGAHGWRFTLENTGSSTVRPAVAGRCLRSKVTATGPGGRSAELAFSVSRPSHSNTVGPGSDTFTHSCGGRFSVATGSIVDPAGSIEMAGSSPTGPAGGRWTFRSASGGDRVRSFLVCLSRASRFR